MKKQILILLIAVLTLGLHVSAQNSTKPQNGYHLTIIQNDNGKEKVIDRTFNNRQEMETFLAERNIDAPEPPQAPEPPAPPSPPGKAVAPAPPSKIEKHKKVKKVVIVEHEEKEGKCNGHREVITEDITGDAGWIEKELEDAEEVKVIIIKKSPKTVNRVIETEVEVGEDAPEEALIKEETPATVTGVKLYPNPNNGEFTINFNVATPADVKLRLTELNGREVYAETLKNFSGKFEKKIAQNSLVRGTYILEIETAGQKESTRIEVQ